MAKKIKSGCGALTYEQAAKICEKLIDKHEPFGDINKDYFLWGYMSGLYFPVENGLEISPREHCELCFEKSQEFIETTRMIGDAKAAFESEISALIEHLEEVIGDD